MPSRLRLGLASTAIVLALVGGGQTADAATPGQPQKPSIKSVHAIGVEGSTAVLLGSINPHGFEVAWYFQLGTTRAYGFNLLRTSLERPIDGGEFTGVEEAVECLAPRTTYHFRVIARSRIGRTYGPDRTFRTKRLRGSPSSIYGDCPGGKPLR